VKRRELIAHLEAHGCVFVREGAKHTWYVGPNQRTFATIPRHREVVDFLARKICRELGVPLPNR
jgi:predicted RNA binding protein YcfA (HicA-like mRNA interferase family)